MRTRMRIARRPRPRWQPVDALAERLVAELRDYPAGPTSRRR
jgi:hypothetical protein